MLSRPHHQKPHENDVEAGDAHVDSQNSATGESSSASGNDMDGLGEYAALDRFVSTYREDTKGADEEDDKAPKKRPWWKFWGLGHEDNRRRSLAPGDGIPEDWLNTDINTGINTADIEPRRRLTGWNELMAAKTNPIAQFIGYFRGPILYVMELAALLAAGLGDWIDFGVIVGILLLNAFVGFYQEKQAADVVASLKGDIAMRCTVVRDGQKTNILARELVLGDIVVIQEGDTVPADARLICDYDHPEDFTIYKRLLAEDKFGHHDSGDEEEKEDGDTRRGSVYYMMQHTNRPLLAVDQSAITGESLAVEKYMGDIVYYTTGCKRGKAYALVTATARQSFVGKTADLVQGANDQGHFKAVMNNIGTSLLVLVMFWIIAAWIGGFFRHIPVTVGAEQTLFRSALILMIVGVPVGLPVVTTTTLAVGAAYLAKQKAIVQKLTAIESLAGVDILCSDKTGTLTANKLSLRDPFVSEGQDVDWMMAVAALASSHSVKSLDPIDKVTVLALKRYPRARQILQQGWVTEKFTPFDPVSKRITAVCRLGEDTFTCAKGAPRAILKLTECAEPTASLYRDKAQEFARRGFRSLGVAVKKNNEPWVLLGLLSMFDPPREDTAQTIIEAAQLGVPVKMLTGDAIAIAKETCKMLSLGTKVYNSEKLIHGGLSGSVQHDFVERADGFAEVFPEHKYAVVEMLQQRGHLTAMTGDGVNDAPSLKKADCGIAVEGSSEAAQAAADIVFLAPGLSTIVLAIKTSRQIFQRMKSYIQYRIALCLHLEIYLVLSMIILNETIRAELIVFIALFADLATVAVAYDNAYWDPRPVEWQLPKIWVISVILGILLAIGTWICRATMLLPSGGIIQNFGSVQEVLFLEVALTENWLIFVTRGGKTWPSWQLVGAIFGVDVLATLFCIFGWLSGRPVQTSPPGGYDQREDGWTDVVTVVIIWLFSFGVTVVIAVVYFLLNKWSWLNNLGRKDRSHKDTKLENVLASLQKLTVEHEIDSKTGADRFHLVEKIHEQEEDL
ncbi:Plasma membrane ATPase-like protein [Emericellopsis cladophorae]|uniref:Plasma membrane ATPase n=1 Tax=Emericellopsis cladophorae TaxID=2686198 RepID=A0A9P9Y6G3_9HYPO|nr:Plasma membrane ATPase-like protein [Emericellopsis cladophorae]KAI6784210.1 Plasma membrane ATPase-like protein [Emericellopsis cladophorae]